MTTSDPQTDRDDYGREGGRSIGQRIRDAVLGDEPPREGDAAGHRDIDPDTAGTNAGYGTAQRSAMPETQPGHDTGHAEPDRDAAQSASSYDSARTDETPVVGETPAVGHGDAAHSWSDTPAVTDPAARHEGDAGHVDHTDTAYQDTRGGAVAGHHRDDEGFRGVDDAAPVDRATADPDDEPVGGLTGDAAGGRHSDAHDPVTHDTVTHDPDARSTDVTDTHDRDAHRADTAAAAAPAGGVVGSAATDDAAAQDRADAVSDETDGHTGGAEPERLVPAARAQEYSARWDSLKGDFVDEPRRAVAQADNLVGDLLDEIQRVFTEQRRDLEQGFAHDDASTEDLRLALRRYRSFFDRLLSF